MIASENRIHHAVFVVEPEHFTDAIGLWSYAFNTPFYGPVKVGGDDGIMVAVSWDVGIELQAPTVAGNGSAQAAILAEKGEGLIKATTSVPDLATTVRRLEGLGYTMGPLFSAVGGAVAWPWSDRFERNNIIAPVEPIFGASAVFCEIGDRIATDFHNRLHHMVFVVHPDNFTAAVSTWSSILNTSFYGPVIPAGDRGLEVAVSWDAGIEIQTPTSVDNDSQVAAALRERGEGLLKVVVNVPDLAAVVKRLEGIGYAMTRPIDGIPSTAPWVDRFEILDEITPKPDFFGATVVLAEIREHARS